MLKEILLGTSLIIGGSVLESYAQSKTHDRSNVPLEKSNELVINTKNKTRKVSVLPESEGIEQLRVFADNSEYEESWLRNPKNNKWFETGYGETGWTDDVYPMNKAFQDSVFIVETLGQLEKAALYHFHSIKGYPDPRKTGVEADRYMANMWSDKQIESAMYLGNTVPSYSDIRVALTLQKKFPEKNPGDIIHKIVSSIGVTEFSFTQKGINKIRSSKSSEVEKKLKYDHARLSRYVIYKNAEAYLDGEKVLDTKEYSKYNAHELLKAWRDEYLEIKFTKFKDRSLTDYIISSIINTFPPSFSFFIEDFFIVNLFL